MLPFLLICSTLIHSGQEPEPPPELASVVEKAAVHCFCDTRTPVVLDLAEGDWVRIIEVREPWSRVMVPGGLTLWVHGRYVDFDGRQGRLNARFVNARPLPSTEAHSIPVGKFDQGDEVLLLERKGEWVRVLAPEGLTGWVKNQQLKKLPTLPARWQAEWKSRGQKRRQSFLKAADSNQAAGQGAVGESGQGGDRQAALAQARWNREARQHLLQAELALARTPSDQIQGAAAQDLQVQFGRVLWISGESEILLRARQGLARLDALVRAAQAPAVAVQEPPKPVPVEKPEVEPDPEPRPVPGLESYHLVGWVEYRPRLYASVPYVIRSGGQVFGLKSPSGRYALRNYIDRKIAVRGTWRPGKIQGLRVLEITDLRVLPKEP
ncbi:MAG: hypothetical protein DWQ01_13575 [Planctomycetota bacterium]|nr:MAG: hypothetical protein DWQ01_13575 [Planctomycetota bacterium]